MTSGIGKASREALSSQFYAALDRAVGTSWGDLNEETQSATKRLVLDSLGIAAAGKKLPGMDMIVRQFEGLAGVRDGVAVPWHTLELGPPDATFLLSAFIHAWDFDDTHDATLVHASSTVVSSAVVAAKLTDCSADRFLNAVAIGVEVACRLGRLVGSVPGIVRTPYCGVFGAAAASAYIAAPSLQSVRNALALAASMAGSTRQVVEDAAFSKRLQAAMAARNGVFAMLLAQGGAEGPPGWLEGTYGILSTMPVEPIAGDVDDGAWEISAISLKPYPSVRYSHAAIAASIALAESGWTGRAERIVISLPDNPQHRGVAKPWNPERGDRLMNAQFSLPWLAAAVLETGSLDLTTIATPTVIQDAQIADLATRVDVKLEMEPTGTGLTPARVEVQDASGGSATNIAERVPGGKEDPLTWTDIEAKLAPCLEVAGLPSSCLLDLSSSVRELPETGLEPLWRVICGSAAA